MNRFDTLKNVYSAQKNYLAASSEKIQAFNFDHIIAQFFCPGPFFYYLLDSPTLTLENCSPSTEPLFGKSFDGESLNLLIERVHPDDFNFMLLCEQYVAKFVKTKITPDKIPKYKFSYCVRFRLKDDTYNLFLLQNIATHVSEHGELLKVMGIHSDISHITETNNYKFSITGLNGEPSYLGLELDGIENIKQKETTHLFSDRELQIIRLLGEGLSATKIAKKLYISEETVKTHKSNSFKKANCKNSTSLVRFCLKEGFI